MGAVLRRGLTADVRRSRRRRSTRSHTSKRALAAAVWQLIADFSAANFRQSARAQLTEELGLTPAHYWALSILDPE
jgi:hypothetical protein